MRGGYQWRAVFLKEKEENFKRRFQKEKERKMKEFRISRKK